jgi:polyribonucleotide nucleotidyltransferase
LKKFAAGGRVEIAASNKECIDKAEAMIKAIVAIPEVGETYKGKIKTVMPYGAFVEFLPGKDGLLHISEIDWKRFERRRSRPERRRRNRSQIARDRPQDR